MAKTFTFTINEKQKNALIGCLNQEVEALSNLQSNVDEEHKEDIDLYNSILEIVDPPKLKFYSKANKNVHFEFEAGGDQKEVEIYIGSYYLSSVSINDISAEAKKELFK